jgi:hypothetical protein
MGAAASCPSSAADLVAFQALKNEYNALNDRQATDEVIFEHLKRV